MKEVKKVFVVGGGLMGAGIAQTAITAGFEVALYDIAPEIRVRARDSIRNSLAKRVQKGKLDEAALETIMGRLTLAGSLEDAASADWVIEAASERLEIKRSIFAELSGLCREDTILATNTSSLSVTGLASAVRNPGRFLGMHFFSPVPVMKLLELVKALGTSDQTMEAAREIGRKLDKICIVSKDSPAFIVNRMLDPMINEAIGLLDAKIGSIEDIDNGMKYGLNHPMGPLELIDMAGIDIELAVMEVLYAETGDPKYRPAELLRNMVRMGWLGRKTGKGFYIYNSDGTRVPNPGL